MTQDKSQLLKWINSSRDALIWVERANSKILGISEGAKQILGSNPAIGNALPKLWKPLLDDKEGTFELDDFRVNVISSDEDSLLFHILQKDTLATTDHADLIFENNVAGIYEADLSGKLITFNRSFAGIMGYDLDDMKHRNGLDLYVHQEDRECFLKLLEKDGSVQNYEIRYQRKDESIVWCLENAFLIDQNGEKSIVGTLVDITEQKHLKDQYEAMYRDSTDAIFLLSEKEILQSNPKCEEFFGYKTDQLLGCKIFSQETNLFQLQDQQVSYIDAKMKRLEEGETGRIQLIGKRKDNTNFYCDVSFTRIDVFQKKQFQVVVRDVSERVFYDDALKSSEERFKLLSEVAIEGVVFVLDEQIRDCNPQFARMFGYKSREEMMSRMITDFIDPVQLRRLEQTLDIKQVNKTEIRSTTRDGAALVLEATGSRISHRNKEYNVFLVYDITARKRAEQELEQSTERFKSVVENSPNGIFILTDGEVKYLNTSGLDLIGLKDEDDVYGESFLSYFHQDDAEEVGEILERVREGEEFDIKEFKMINSYGDILTVGMKATLSVYDSKPSINITLNNLTTRIKLMQETLRAQLAEEINVVLKKEIEQHKLTQQKLREAENFVRNIIDSSIDMIIAVDDNDCITEFNPAALEHFGYRSSEIIGEKASILYAHPEEYESIQKRIQKGQTFSGEIQNVKKDGHVFTSFISANVIRNNDGEVLGSMGVSRDVTEIKKAEQVLRESKERYRDLFENASDMIFAVDGKGHFLYANKSFRETLGYSIKELEKHVLGMVVINHEIKACDNLFDGFATKPMELEFVSKDGRTIKAFGDSSVRKKEGEPDMIRAIFRDITDLRRHEQAALEQAARLESVFNSTENLMMWTLDLEGKITSFNKNFEVWSRNEFPTLRLDDTDFIGTLKEIVDPDAYQGQMDNFTSAYTGKPQQFELPLVNAHGNSIWMEVFLNPVKVKNTMGEISCIAYDITDRKEIDRRILGSLKEKEVLLQEVHHRVKNNLQVISSILNIQSSFVDDERTLQLLEESQRRIKTMSYIHESLYQTADFSSIEFTDYINTLSRNLIQSYAAIDTEVTLHTDFDNIFLNLDQAIPCGLIVNELVSNAMKYAYGGRAKGELFISIKENDGKVTMEVRDNGVGLPENFKYEESESLGIYLVYALVEQLDADIQVESDSGTSFLLTFDKQ